MPGSVHKKALDIKLKGSIASRTRQGLKRARQKQENQQIIKIKKRTCYTCWLKGHLSKDCPNGTTSESKVVNTSLSVHGKTKMGNGARKVIKSPHVSTRTIWVPKFLMTNIEGPNRAWVPKNT